MQQGETRIYKGDRITKLIGSRVPIGAEVKIIRFLFRRRVVIEYQGERMITMLYCLTKQAKWYDREERRWRLYPHLRTILVDGGKRKCIYCEAVGTQSALNRRSCSQYIMPGRNDKYATGYARRIYGERLAAGLCPRCGAGRDTKWFHCQNCIDYMNSLRGPRNVKRERERKRAWRNRWREQELCTKCGRKVYDEHMTCEHCRRIAREQKKNAAVTKLFKQIVAAGREKVYV
jgi:hypothetical protein